MEVGGRKLTTSDLIIWAGVVLGILDWVTDAAYAATQDFEAKGVKSACVTFVLGQPVWYFFIFLVYIGCHEQIEDVNERRQQLRLALPYTILQQFKLMGGFESHNEMIQHRFRKREQFTLCNLENSYRVQIAVELVLETLPQIVIQARNNNAMGWSGAVPAVSFCVSVLVLVKDLAIVTIYVIRKYVEHRDNVSVRPRSYVSLQNTHKLDKDSIRSMQAYLKNEEPEGPDEDGNTTLHLKAKTVDDGVVFDQEAAKVPHQLFMLNKQGQTPLDICIEDDCLADCLLELTNEQDSPLSLRNEVPSDSVKPIAYPMKEHSRNKMSKVIDESQTLPLKNKLEADQAERRATAEAKYLEWVKKTKMLLKRMQKYHHNCSMQFLKSPHRLDLKYERSFTMAVKKGRTQILELFPKNTVKTVYVSTSQLRDVRQYKAQKRSRGQGVITTPLHLACQTSNVEAARILLTDHNYDVNILLYEKNFLCDLLTTGSYEDFSILSNVFKKRKPCVNSGQKMPLNLAILRGNQYIIQTLLEHGSPNPYAKDVNGITPIHAACAKLDWDTFDDLVQIGGDPLLPDKDGNTFLHLLCEGGIKDVEYDFAKMACQQFNIKLTRNNQGKTPLNLLRSMKAAPTGNTRGQPNYRGRLCDYFENILKQDPTFEDHDVNTDLHLAIIRDDLSAFEEIMKREDFVRRSLNLRNMDGKSPIFLTIVHGRQTMFEKLFEAHSAQIDFRAKDTIHGNTPLHVACTQENIEVVRKIYQHDPELCMQPNFLGRSPFFVACQRKNLELLKVFEDWKSRAVVKQDYLGENMLFVCAREGEAEIFNWFSGSNDFFRARGQQNYKGQTIEHVVCIACQTSIVQDIRPKLDTRDYYGNLPIHYTIANDDHLMVQKYFTGNKAYYDLRNFKHETVFHIAAKHNSVKSMKALIGRSIFQEEVLKRDFKGDTPLHTAAKTGSLEFLELLLTACTPSFLELQNDFGLTPMQALQEKVAILEDKQSAPECTPEDHDKLQKKVDNLQAIEKFLVQFDDFVDEDSWNERFEIPLAVFLETTVDPNLKIFFGMEDTSFLRKDEYPNQQLINSKKQDEPQVQEDQANNA